MSPGPPAEPVVQARNSRARTTGLGSNSRAVPCTIRIARVAAVIAGTYHWRPLSNDGRHSAVAISALREPDKTGGVYL